jgi:hypothetical protein
MTPQILTTTWAGIRYELDHGATGGMAAKLWFYQWPDLGFFALTHWMGWGLSWPLTVMALVGMFFGYSERKKNPLCFWTVAAMIVWYIIIELTPLKRSADTERYVIPCIPLGAVLAAGVMGYWRPARILRIVLPQKFWKFSPLIILLPMVHSLALAHAAQFDTRKSATLWLVEHGPSGPYTIVYLGEPSFQLDPSYLRPEAEMERASTWREKDEIKADFKQAPILAMSELDFKRYESFPLHSQLELKMYETARKTFPYVKYFRKRFYEKAGFNNPDIELRFRTPYQGLQFEP